MSKSSKVDEGIKMQKSLYESENIVLTEMNFDLDAEIDAQYSFDLLYSRQWFNEIIRPLSKNEFKKLYEKTEKEIDDRGETVHFAVRSMDNQELLGFLQFKWISWNNGVGSIVIALGKLDSQKGIEAEVISLACQYAFTELNLFRIEINVLSIEHDLIEALEICGFDREVTISDGVFLFGDYHDVYLYGILQPEWEMLSKEGANDQSN